MILGAPLDESVYDGRYSEEASGSGLSYLVSIKHALEDAGYFTERSLIIYLFPS